MAQPLGSALLILDGCSTPAIRSGCAQASNSSIQTPAACSVRAIRQFLAESAEPPASETTLLRDRRPAAYVCRPLLQMAQASTKSRAKVAELLLWLFDDAESGAVAARGLSAAVCDVTDKRAGLQAVRVLRQGAAGLRLLGLRPATDAATADAATGSPARRRALAAALPGLVCCAAGASGSAVPTRLMAEAADCAADLLVGLFPITPQAERAELTTQLTRLLGAVAQWYEQDAPLYTAAARALAGLVDPVGTGRPEGGGLQDTMAVVLALQWAAQLLYCRPPSIPVATELLGGMCRQGAVGAAPYNTVAAVCAGLALGRCPADQMVEVLDDAGIGVAGLDQLFCLTESSCLQPIRELRVAFARAALAAGDSSGAALLLLGLVRGTDALAVSAAGLVLEIAESRPDYVWEPLEEQAKSPEPSSQLEALQTVDGLLDNCGSQMSSGFNRRLLAMAIPCLASDDVIVGGLAVAICAKLDPDDAVALLLQQLGWNRRSSMRALEALVAMLNTAKDPCVVAAELLRAASCSSNGTVPAHPGELLTSKGAAVVGRSSDKLPDGEVERNVECVLEVFAAWAADDQMGLRWQLLVPFVVEAVISKPEDRVAIKLVGKLGKVLSRLDCVKPLLTSVLKVLHEQPPLEIAASDDENELSEAMKLLLFQRLSPLLLLRALPVECFTEPELGRAPAALRFGDCDNALRLIHASLTEPTDAQADDSGLAQPTLEAELLTAVFLRTVQKFEFTSIRKVAAELLSRCESNMAVCQEIWEWGGW